MREFPTDPYLYWLIAASTASGLIGQHRVLRAAFWDVLLRIAGVDKVRRQELLLRAALKDLDRNYRIALPKRTTKSEQDPANPAPPSPPEVTGPQGSKPPESPAAA
jgi:hypothetical protein